MAKGQHLTPHQQGIVKRYYNQLDTILLQKLQELISELAVSAGDAKAQGKLWPRVETAIAKLELDPSKVRAVLASRDVAGLAKLVEQASRPGR